MTQVTILVVLQCYMPLTPASLCAEMRMQDRVLSVKAVKMMPYVQDFIVKRPIMAFRGPCTGTKLFKHLVLQVLKDCVGAGP